MIEICPNIERCTTIKRKFESSKKSIKKWNENKLKQQPVINIGQPSSSAAERKKNPYFCVSQLFCGLV